MKIPQIEIDNRSIGQDHPPYVIAEMSANHNGDLQRAFRIIEEAKNAGASAVKLQTYSADTITLDCDAQDFKIVEGPWAGQTLYQLYKSAQMPWEWHKPLFKKARDIDITIFSSPFDQSAVDLLEELGTPAYKIASFEVLDLPLIKYIGSKKKPIIISTGMASSEEIADAVSAAKEGGAHEIALLHCVSAYPSSASEYNLRTLPDMFNRYGTVVGLSDHTVDNTTAIASVAMGASIIEKHFTLNRDGKGPDDFFSLEPVDFRNLCTAVHTAWEALGDANYDPKPSELPNLKFRRSLYFVKKMKRGQVIAADCVMSVRPGFGLPPKWLDLVVGRPVLTDVDYGTPVLEKHIG